MTLRTEEPPRRRELSRRLAIALAGYRSRKDDLDERTPELAEVFSLWEIPQKTTIASKLVLENYQRWFAQLFLGELPSYYARCAFDAEGWRVDWIGGAWLAEAVEAAVTFLEAQEQLFNEVIEVRLVSSRRFRFTAFWLVESDLFLVASAMNSDLPNDELITREELRTTLRASEGSRGWIRE